MDVGFQGESGSRSDIAKLSRMTRNRHLSIKGRRLQPAKVARGPNAESPPRLISSRNWMGCAEHGNSGKHEHAYGLLHRDAAVEHHRVFSVTSRRLRT
jgi:hypothetical protein